MDELIKAIQGFGPEEYVAVIIIVAVVIFGAVSMYRRHK
jgi:hypothetical protein